jgi:hypothetical protein
MSWSPLARPGSQDQARRCTLAAQLLDREAQREQVAGQAPVALGERDGQDVVVGQQPPDVLGEHPLPVDLGGPGCDLLVGQDPHGIPQEDLLLRQADRAVDRRVRGHRAPSYQRRRL